MPVAKITGANKENDNSEALFASGEDQDAEPDMPLTKKAKCLGTRAREKRQCTSLFLLSIQCALVTYYFYISKDTYQETVRRPLLPAILGSL